MPGGSSLGAARGALFLALVLGCDGSDVAAPKYPTPILEAIEPTLVTRSASPVTVTLRGLGFAEGAEARWNGEARATGYIGPTQLTATLSPQDLLLPVGEIDVVNPSPGGGASSALTLLVGNPSPTLASISPTQAPAVITSELMLHAQGGDFVTGSAPSVLLWNGIPLATDVTSASQLSATVPDYLLRVGHAAEITVRNPAPGGGASNALYFDVENPVPSVTGTDPDGVPALTEADLEVQGSGFVHGATVWMAATQLTPTSTSATRLTVRVPPAATAGGQSTAPLRVENPGPGGGTSNTIDLTVWISPPRIDYVAPSRIFAGSPDVTVVIVGSDFDPSAVVLWEGGVRDAIVVSPQRIEVTVLASDLTLEGTYDLTVVNPGNSGQASTPIIVLPASAATTRVVAERWGTLQMVFSELDGSDATTINIPGGGSRVDASPVGPTAVYHSNGGRVFELDPATGVSRRMTTAADETLVDEERWPRYSADGSWIYFAGRASATGRTEIWRARTDGSGAEPVLSDPNRNLDYPAPSHDGKRVVYTSDGEYWVYDRETSSSTLLGDRGLTSRWSPGDEWVVYLTENWDLKAVRPDGTDRFTVVSTTDVGHGFDFSPDGSSIVGTTQAGDGILIQFPSGAIQSLPGLGQIGSVAWFGP